MAISCYRCRDLGEIDGCPDCQKIKSLGPMGSISVTKENLTRHQVPVEYQNIQWDPIILETTHPHMIGDPSFTAYCEQLTKLIEIFRRGELPQQSAIIVAPRSFAKLTFAYCCMNYGISNGYTVAPLLDTTEVKRINELSADNYTTYTSYKLPKIEELIGSDILFITVDKDRYGTALRTIESIMDKRSRQGRATIVLSRFTTKVMSQFEKRNSYDSLFEPTRRFNNKKFPVYLYLEEKGR